MKYVSIDIETTGLDPSYHQMIEFGAAIEDTEKQLSTCELPKFRALIKHDDYVINPYCLRLHAKLLDELTLKQKDNPAAWYIWYEEDKTYVCRPDALTFLFKQWLTNNGISPDTKVIVAGKNFNKFDINFIDPIFKSQIKFHRRVLDPVVLFTQPTDQEPPNLSECAKRAGVEFTGSGYHTAVSDAVMVIELLRKGWSLKEKKL